MAAPTDSRQGLRRSLSVWQAVGISVALMAPSMAANINLWGNVLPYPTEGPEQWFPVVAFGWLAFLTVLVVAVPRIPRRLTDGMASMSAEHDEERV